MCPHPVIPRTPPLCHSELVEESPAFTAHYVREIVLSCNLIVSINALLLSFQIPRYARNDSVGAGDDSVVDFSLS